MSARNERDRTVSLGETPSGSRKELADFLFALVIETGEVRSRFLGSQPLQGPADGVGAIDRYDGHAFGLNIASRSPGGQRQGELVGHSFNQDDRAHSGILP